MTTNKTLGPDGRRLSRRELLKAIGVTGLVVAGGANAFPMASRASGAQDDSPEGFLARAYAERARAMTTRDFSALDTLYDSTDGQLLTFERDRAAFMNDLGSRWDGKLLEFASTASLADLRLSGSTATGRIYETTRVLWIPFPRAVSAAGLEQRKKCPEKFVSTTPTGPKGEVTSTIIVRHEIILSKQTTGWRIARDSYEEPDLLGASPHLVPGSWSSEITGRPPNNTLKGQASAQGDVSVQGAYYNYDFIAAKNYARAYANGYSSTYCCYENCGGDCTNFVSQCFRFGNQITDGTWNTRYLACNCSSPGPSEGQAGTTAWVNNVELRSWALNSGRGNAMTAIDQLGIADLINYDWTGDGAFEHAAIYTDPVNRFICSHTPARLDAPWQQGAKGWLYTWMKPQYYA